jgi:hypothetical protein
MRPLTALPTLGVIVAISGGVWVYAQQQKTSSPMLSPQDYLEIQQLYGYYTRDVDPGSERDASWLYAPDGTFEFRGQKQTGQKALQEFYARVRKGQMFGIRHLNSNFLLLPTPEGARGTAYMVQVERRDASKPINVTLFGVYHDTFVKTAEGWKFKSRVLRQDGPDAPLPKSD